MRCCVLKNLENALCEPARQREESEFCHSRLSSFSSYTFGLSCYGREQAKRAGLVFLYSGGTKQKEGFSFPSPARALTWRLKNGC